MTFNELNMAEPILKAVREKGYDELTPIQQRAIPIALRGADILGIAQTGTGKTAAFALPLLQRLIEERSFEREPSAVAGETVPLRRERRGRSHGKSGRRAIRSLVLTPTRELALQIGESFADYGKYTGLKHATIFGGVKQGPQTDRLRRGVDILIATPGRLLDLIAQGEIELGSLSHFVLDEADRMLDMGFIADIRRLLPLLPVRRQTLLFSATMPRDIVALSGSVLRDPVRVEVTPASSTVDRVDQRVYFVERPEKKSLLVSVLRKQADKSVLVFSRTKHGADNIARIAPRQLVLISSISVYDEPKGADEDTPIHPERLTAYGANRRWLEQWVEEQVPGHLIVRLPALYGRNLKKNFLYDYLHFLPPMLTQAKRQELGGQEPLILDSYQPLGNA